MLKITPEEILEYHRGGKISVQPSKPLETQRDLSIAYTPGVAIPVLEIEKDPLTAYDYTDKGNLVAVISNGTAILGLGDRGALASKPVMEGKGVLFKKFADIDVFDIELDSHDPEEVIQVVTRHRPHLWRDQPGRYLARRNALRSNRNSIDAGYPGFPR